MPLARSWVESANAPETDFPLNNLPCGAFSVRGGAKRCGVAIGDRILDVSGLEAAGVLRANSGVDLLATGTWNAFMELGPDAWAAWRTALSAVLASDAPPAAREAGAAHLVPMGGARLHLPFRVAEFTDFYASKHHATNVGTMFRGPDDALPPNWLHMPIGYNGRASSVVVSGTPVRRPWGQLRDPGAAGPRFAPSERFDFELELGAIVGRASDGALSIDRAESSIFGYVLLNDWSARDIQAWEYRPLGPFQGKASATTISPWIVTAASLEPFRRPAPPREIALLPHLADTGPMHFDIELSAELNGETVCRTNAAELYYSAAQQLAHHASGGCPMRVGDLLGSGTISGAEAGSRGSLLELCWGGERPLELADGTRRSFLLDGDTVTLRGAARGEGYRIGFGACSGTVLPAHDDPFEGQR